MGPLIVELVGIVVAGCAAVWIFFAAIIRLLSTALDDLDTPLD